MDFHINRKIALSRDSEFKNLYQWSLQEWDADGKKIGSDQIPWNWTLYFTAHQLILGDTLAIERDWSTDGSSTPVVREKQFISAKLLPGGPWVRDRLENTVYSMFGTDRSISTFELSIQQLESDDQQEHCRAWGAVSYTSEVDFRNETTEDTVLFSLYVRPETFRRYVAKIGASDVDRAVLRVHGVAGFYSNWSPSISTNAIKVLTSHREQAIQTPDGCEIAPPRLGTIAETEFSLHRIVRLNRVPADSTNDEAERLVEGRGEPSTTDLGGQDQANDSQTLRSLTITNVKALSVLSSLRLAAWIIAALLLISLLNHSQH